MLNVTTGTADTAIRQVQPIKPIAYSPADAARASGRSRTRIYRALRDKEIFAFKDGRATLIPHAELARWIGSLPTIGRDPSASEGLAA